MHRDAMMFFFNRSKKKRVMNEESCRVTYSPFVYTIFYLENVKMRFYVRRNAWIIYFGLLLFDKIVSVRIF